MPSGASSSSFIEQVSQRASVTPFAAEMPFWDQWARWHFRMQPIPYVDELSAGERSAFERSIRFAYCSHRWMKLWYESNRQFLDPDAVNCVDDVLAQSG